MKLGIAAICFLADEERILLMRAPWADDRWSVIGGKVEPGETPEQAMRREVREETGLTVTRCREAGHLYLAEGESGTSLHLYVADAWTGELRGSEEGEPVWWSRAAAERLPMIDFVRTLLPHVLTPNTLVTGTIRPGGESAVQVYRVAGSESLTVPDSPAEGNPRAD